MATARIPHERYPVPTLRVLKAPEFMEVCMSMNQRNEPGCVYLQVLRNTLFLSPNEAASLFPNMTLDHWNNIESGRSPAPSMVMDRFNAIFEYRNKQLVMYRQMIESSPNARFDEFWFQTMDDWMAIDDHEPEGFRVTQSLNASLATEYPSRFKLYPFDLVGFTAWACGRPATAELLSEYLGFVSSPRAVTG